VTSTVQIEAVSSLPKGSVQGLIVSNRQLEDFSFDTTGQQVLDLLKSDALTTFRSNHGDDILVMAEGRVGLIERGGGDTLAYIKELKDAGASGAFVGAGLVVEGMQDPKDRLQELANAS
jgi:indole-3-glycerol phosphate synthase